MDEDTTNQAAAKRLRQVAIAGGVNEAAVEPMGLQEGTQLGEAPGTPLALTDAEVVQLQIRVIALENLVIALLGNAPEAAREQAKDLAANISPRPGFTQHRLTLHAASQMKHLVERASQLLGAAPKAERPGG